MIKIFENKGKYKLCNILSQKYNNDNSDIYLVA